MRYALTDIHGCSATLNLLLHRIDLQPEDELFFLGDYIDRGPDSHGVIEIIRGLQDEGQSVVCLRGNHEQMLIEYLEQRHPFYSASWTKEEQAWFNALPYYHLLPDYVLVHAGLNFESTDPLSDLDSLIWIRNWEGRLDQEWLGDRTILYGHTPQSHALLKQDIASRRPVLCLDTGCAHKYAHLGYLTAYNMDTREATFVRRIDF